MFRRTLSANPLRVPSLGRSQAGDGLDEAYARCEAITASHSKSFHFSTRFLPAGRRRAIRAFYAFCRTTDVVHCAERKIPGLAYPGGWAQSITVPADALAAIPDGDLRSMESVSAFAFAPALTSKFSLSTLFMTHTPLEKRLEQLARISAQLGQR